MISKKDELLAGGPTLFASMLGVAIGISSLYYYTIGLFIKPLQAEFGWSRTSISSVQFAGSLTIAILAPVVGALTDRYGTRRVAAVSLISLALGFMALSQTTGVFLQFLLLSIMLNVLGSGTTPVVYTRLVNQWFTRARGLALGTALAGTGITATLAPNLLGRFMENHGWRSSYQIMALIVVIITPLILYWLRQPKQKTTSADTQTSPPNLESGLTLPEARVTREFWMIATTLFLVAVAMGGIVTHLVPLLTDAGVPLVRATSIAGILGGSVIFGRILTGILIDRYFAPYVALCIFSVTGLGCAVLAVGGADYAIFAAAGIGFSLGAEIDFIGYFVARYFGIKSYGKIYGLLYATFMIGMSIGPVLAGYIFDVHGNYYLYLWIATASLVCASVVASRLPAFPNNP